jgi:hypothetical protein
MIPALAAAVKNIKNAVANRQQLEDKWMKKLLETSRIVQRVSSMSKLLYPYSLQ